MLPLPFLFACLTAACAATQPEERPSEDEPVATESLSAEELTDAWIAEHRPELIRIEQLVAGSEFDVAREALLVWTEPGLAELSSGLDDMQAVRFTYRVELLAGRLALPSLERDSRAQGVDLLRRLLPEDHPELLAAEGNLALSLQAFGDLEGARALAEHVHATWARVLPEDHPTLLHSKQNLAVIRVAVGDVAGARELCVQIHDVRARVLPADDPELLQAKQNLAFVHKLLGDLPASLALEEEVHAALERLLPAEHPALLDAKKQLATTRSASGDVRGALELERHVLAVRERTLPAEHLDLLHAKLNLGATLEAMGDIDGAHALFEQVLAVRERILPPDDFDLLDTKLNLAVTRYGRGDLVGAHALFEQVHEAFERLLPEDDARVLVAKQNLASSRKELGDLHGARALEEDVLALRSRSLPADHPDLLRARMNLAQTSSQLGEWKSALEQLELVHEEMERSLPPDHRDFLRAKASLAIARGEAGDLRGAYELEVAVLAAYERSLAPDHPWLLVAQSNLATTLHTLGDSGSATALFEKVHAIREASLSADHPDLLDAKQNLALARRSLGDLQSALELQEHVLAARERLLPTDHPDLLESKQNLATTRRELGDFDGARVLAAHVLAAREAALAPDHPDLLNAKQNMAVNLHEVGDIEGARDLLEHVLDVVVSRLSEDHPTRLALQQNLAVARRELGDLVGARELEEHVFAVRARTLPAEHPELLDAMQNLAGTLRTLGDTARARELEEDVHSIRSRLLPPDHPALLDARKNLAAARAADGDLAGLRELTSAALEGAVAVAATATIHAPRFARSLALREIDRLAWQACWCETLVAAEIDAPTPELFLALECLRFVSTASIEVACATAQRPELGAVRRELAVVRQELADASRIAPADAGAIEAWRESLHARAEERDRLQRELRRALAESGLRVEMPTLDRIRSSVPPDGALVSFWRHDRWTEREPGSGDHFAIDSLTAFVLTPDGSVRSIGMGPIRPLEEAVEGWRRALGASIEPRGLGIESETSAVEVEVGRALRAQLLDPVLAVLGERSPRVLVVVPDDLVHLVPLDALPREDGSRVGDSIEVRVEPSVARLIRTSIDAPSSGTLVAFGGVDYGANEARAANFAVAVATVRSGGQSFVPLSGTLAEVRATLDLFEQNIGEGASVEFGAGATESALVDLAPRARYLHLATHGWFTSQSAAVSMLDELGDADDALRRSAGLAQETIVGFLPETLCGLALAGANHGSEGILTAEELATLDLTNCELAVLSACETNVGIRRAGQGIQSLQTALHAAGARTAICSLWKVDDAATRRLFELFYTKLWKDRLGKADALWQAKLALRAEGHPTRDWAGWVLTGDPD